MFSLICKIFVIIIAMRPAGGCVRITATKPGTTTYKERILNLISNQDVRPYEISLQLLLVLTLL